MVKIEPLFTNFCIAWLNLPPPLPPIRVNTTNLGKPGYPHHQKDFDENIELLLYATVRLPVETVQYVPEVLSHFHSILTSYNWTRLLGHITK